MAEDEKNLKVLAEEAAILFHESAQYQPLPDVQAVLVEASMTLQVISEKSARNMAGDAYWQGFGRYLGARKKV